MSKLSQFYPGSGHASVPKNTDIEIIGNIIGLTYTKTGANQILVSKGVCKDSTGQEDLALIAPATVTIPNTPNTVFNLFLCEDGTIKADPDIKGASISMPKRWISFITTDGTGALHNMIMSYDGSEVCFVGGIKVGGAHHTGRIYTSASGLGDISGIVPMKKIYTVGATCDKESGGWCPGTFVASVAATGEQLYHSGNEMYQVGTMAGTKISFAFSAGGGGAGTNIKCNLFFTGIIR